MDYLLLAIAVALSLSYNALTRSARLPAGGTVTLRFNIAVAAAAAVVALVFGGRPALPARATLAWGALYGLVTATSLITRLKALESGPLAPTLLIGCSSMVVTTLVGTVLWHESVSAGQIVGVLVMLAAMALSLRRDRRAAATRLWPLYALGLFLTNALIGLIFKAHQSTAWAGEAHLLVGVGYLVSVLLLAAACAVLRPSSGAGQAPGRRALLVAGLCGCALCACSILNTRLSGALPSIVFFPIYNGAVIVFSAPLSLALFHERISRAQLAGIALAVAAVLLIGGVVSL